MPLAGFRRATHRYLLSPSLAGKGPVPNWEQGLRLSKKWLAPLFRGVHSSLAPTARPGSYAEKPLLRKAFCGFDAHPPRGPSLVPSGQFTLCRQIRSKPPEGKAERRQWREERGGSPVSKGAPGRPHGPTQRDLCELHCGPRTPKGFSTGCLLLGMR